MVVYHHRRELLLPFLKQIARYGRHRGQFAHLFPETSRLISYFVPSLFVLGLIFGPMLALLFPMLWTVYFSATSLYFLLLAFESLRAGFEERSVLAAVLFMIGVFETHLVYGINFLIGFIVKPTLELRQVDKMTGNYLGG